MLAQAEFDLDCDDFNTDEFKELQPEGQFVIPSCWSRQPPVLVLFLCLVRARRVQERPFCHLVCMFAHAPSLYINATGHVV